MMISKDIFIETMRKLERLDEKMDNVDSALKDLCPDCGGFYFHDPFDIVMHLLAEIFNDTDDWLGYLVYECDFLNTCGRIIDTNAEDEVELYNWGDVYDFLIKKMKEE